MVVHRVHFRSGWGSSRLARRLLLSLLLCSTVAAVAPAQPTSKGDGLPGLPRNAGSSTRASDRALAELSRDIGSVLSDRNFIDASWGVSIISCDNGESIFRSGDRQNRQVASNIKMLTTATALRRLGSDFRFGTEIFISGTIQPNGALNGNVVIRTSGDPSLSPTFGIDPQAVLRGWAKILDSLGIRSVEDVIVDASAFDNIPYAPGWAWDDEPFGYNAQISAAAIYDNSVSVTVTPGRAPGRSVLIDISPSTAFVTLKVTATTSRDDSLSTLDIRRDRGSSTIVVSGNIAAGAEAYTEHISIERPPLYFATLVKEELVRSGIAIRGSAYDAEDYPERYDYPALRKVALYRSPALREIAAATNKQSLNLSAEMLLKRLGRELGGIGSTVAGLDVIRQMLSEIGVDTEHLRLYDGSGLSRQDMIAPADITTFLRWARRSTISTDFQASLARAGEDGTLANRMRGTLAENNVIAKTGYLNGIRAISGYARTRDGEWLAFSIVANNYSVPTSVVNTAQDMILMRLASFSRKT